MINDWPCPLIVSSVTILHFTSNYKEEWVSGMGTVTDTDREWPWDCSVCWPHLQIWQTAPRHSQVSLMLWWWGHWAGKTVFKVGCGFMAWEFKREGESGDCVRLSKSKSWGLESFSRTPRKSEQRIVSSLLIFFCRELIMVEEALEIGMQRSLKNYKASPNSHVFLVSDGVKYGSLSPVNSFLHPSWRCSCRHFSNPQRLLQGAPGCLR